MSSASGKNVTLVDLPGEIILGLAATHLDPVDPPALHALVSLIDMGLVDARDVEELYAHQHERPFPWEWLVAWPDHFKATFANEGRASPITVWLEKLFVEACRRGWIDLIELLVCRGARPLTDHLIDAASAGKNDVIDLLVVQYGLDPAATSDLSSWSPLYAACMYGRESTIRHLITTYNVDYRARTATGEHVASALTRRFPRCRDLIDQLLRDDSII